MKRRNLINLVLVVALIALAAVTWLMPDETSNPASVPLTSLDPQSVNHIRLSNNNGPSFVLLRVDGNWRMESPHQIEANTPRIEILLDLVSTPSLENFGVPSGELKQFGLDKPRATIWFNETKLVIGGTHPYNYRRYIRNGNQIHLTKDAFPHHLLALAEDYISHQIFQPEEQIIGIKSDTWRIQQNEQKQWLIKPPAEDLSSEQLARIVEEWNHSWAKKVIPIPTEKETQKITLTLRGKNTPVMIEIIPKPRELILIRRDKGVAYRLPASTVFTPPE